MLLKTDRIIIRDYQVDDIKKASSFLLDKETMHYIPETFNSEKDVEEFLNERLDKYFVVELIDTKEIIGHLYFTPFFEDHSYEIGWVFDKRYHGKGLAFEAAYKIMDYGFKELKIHRIIATCQPENTSSWNLMEKLKMRKEAEFKECIAYKDEWWDEYYYAILKREWL